MSALRLVSLDHFRSRIYRPRLALVILLVLLSGCVTPPAPGAVREHERGHDNDAAAAGAATTAADTTAGARHRVAGTSAFVGNPFRSSGGGSGGDGGGEDGSDQLTDTTLSWSPFSSSPASDEKRQRRTGSHLFVISLFLSPAIFPTLVQLHLLWTVRFVAGEVEGRLSASRRPAGSSSSSVTLTILALAAVIGGVLHPATTQWLHDFASRATAGSATFNDPTTLFPSMWIVLVECVPAWLALTPLLLFVQRSGGGSIIPQQLRVPSPSHLPSLIELLPFWIRAPFTPSEQYRARRSAILATRTRRHGAFANGGAGAGAMLRLDEDVASSGRSSEVEDGGGAASAATSATHSRSPTTTTTATTDDTETPLRSRETTRDDDALPHSPPPSHDHLTTLPDMEGRSTSEAQRVLRLQQAMVDELEKAGRLSRDRSGGSTPRAATSLKALHQRHQRVTLPTSYVLSIALSLLSSLSLMVCYSLIAFKLPNLAPTSVPAIVSLLALRAEIGGVVKYWNQERRRVEGLEFVRRRWGVTHSGSGSDRTNGDTAAAPPPPPAPSNCSICFEPIIWSSSSASSEGDGVRLDCQHELHAPCLVPWLMSQSFCPVCHRPLRPSGSSGASSESSRDGNARHRRRRRSQSQSGHRRQRTRDGGGGGAGGGTVPASSASAH